MNRDEEVNALCERYNLPNSVGQAIGPHENLFEELKAVMTIEQITFKRMYNLASENEYTRMHALEKILGDELFEAMQIATWDNAAVNELCKHIEKICWDAVAKSFQKN